MNFDIDALRILINTNVPDANLKKINFTRNMLTRPPDEKKEASNLILNDLPFFTYDVLYPRALLIKMTYQDRINFFFNIDRFNELLTPYINDKLDHKEIETNPDEFYKKRYRIINKNVITMLLVLFPTKYPMINELYDSYSYVVNHRKQVHGIMFNPFAKQFFSYLNINGKSYTVKSVTWLNDIMNHPLYSNFLQQYSIYYKLANEEIKKTDKKIDALVKTITSKLNEIINYLDKVLTDVVINNNKFLSGPAIAFFNSLGKTVSYMDESYVNKFNDLVVKYNEYSKTKKNSNVDTISKNTNDFKKDYAVFYNKLTVITPPSQWTSESAGLTKDLLALHIDHINQIKRDLIKESSSSELKNALTVYNLYFSSNYMTLKREESKSSIIGKLITGSNSVNNIRTINKSSNQELQELVDMDTAADAIKFHKLMQGVYEYTKNETSKLPQPTELLNTGITFINLNQTNTSDKKTPRYEINIMIDLIEGIVDDNNKNKINCSYLNEYLGNELEILGRNVDFQQFSNFKKNKLNDWRIDKNRMLYSLEKSGFKQQPMNGQKGATNTQPNYQQQIGTVGFQNTGAVNNLLNENIFKAKNVTDEIPNFDSLNNQFISIIDTSKDIANALNNYNTASAKISKPSLSKQDLLMFLIKKNNNFKNIYTTGLDSPSESYKIALTAQNDIVAKLNLIEAELIQPNNSTKLPQEEIDKKEVDKKLYELYQKILKGIVETKKQQATKGFIGGGLEDIDNSISTKKITAKKRNISNRTHKILH
jgi:hypothetical protein